MTTTPKTGLTDKFRPPTTKVCRLCKEGKPISSFSQNIKNKDGYMHECRACMKDREDQKLHQRKEQAKTFFDAKYFTFFFLLLSSTAFSQAPDTTLLLRVYNWGGPVMVPAEGIPIGYTVAIKSDSFSKPDTVRAIILATMCRKCAAEPMPGYVVIEQGKRPIYLNRCKKALKLPQVGWGYEIVNTNKEAK